MIKYLKAAVLGAMLSFSATSQAIIIDNGDYTTDTDQNLNFLDLGLVADGSWDSFASGISYSGQTWYLASLVQMNNLFENMMGVTIPDNYAQLGDFGLPFAGLTTALDLMVPASSNISPWFWLADETSSSTALRNIFHTDGNNDMHVQDVSKTGTINALLVSRTQIQQVPEPATLALFGLGMAGLGMSRRMRKV